MRTQSQELLHAVQHGRGLAEQPLALDHHQPRAREMLDPPVELLGIMPTAEVGVAMVADAVVGRIASQALLLARQPIGFTVEGLGQGQRLPAARDLVLVVREGAVDRIPQQRDELYVGKQLGDPVGDARMEEVVRCGLERDRPAPQPAAIGETPLIPPGAAIVS
jgi:hypothetical protein